MQELYARIEQDRGQVVQRALKEIASLRGGVVGLVLLPRRHYRREYHYLVLDGDDPRDGELWQMAIDAFGGAGAKTFTGWDVDDCDVLVVASMH